MITRTERLKARRRMRRQIRLLVEERRFALTVLSTKPLEPTPVVPSEPAA